MRLNKIIINIKSDKFGNEVWKSTWGLNKALVQGDLRQEVEDKQQNLYEHVRGKLRNANTRK